MPKGIHVPASEYQRVESSVAESWVVTVASLTEYRCHQIRRVHGPGRRNLRRSRRLTVRGFRLVMLFWRIRRVLSGIHCFEPFLIGSRCLDSSEQAIFSYLSLFQYRNAM